MGGLVGGGLVGSVLLGDGNVWVWRCVGGERGGEEGVWKGMVRRF